MSAPAGWEMNVDQLPLDEKAIAFVEAAMAGLPPTGLLVEHKGFELGDGRVRILWNRGRPLALAVVVRDDFNRSWLCTTKENAMQPPDGSGKTVTKWVPTTDLMMLRRMGKLQEELSELGGVAARCIIQGIDEVDPGSGDVNRLRLEQEIADVYAQLDETVARLGLREAFIDARRGIKRGYMQEWEQMFAEPAHAR